MLILELNSRDDLPHLSNTACTGSTRSPDNDSNHEQCAKTGNGKLDSLIAQNPCCYASARHPTDQGQRDGEGATRGTSTTTV